MKRALVLTLLLAGCTVGPDYKQPDTPMPASYSAPSQTGAPLSMPVAESADLSQWWMQFHDAELESLIARALAQNPDLLTAQSRVRQAREQEVIAGAQGLPQINATGNTVRVHSDSNLQQKLGAGGGAGAAPSSGSTDIKLYSAGFDATWEIDVFGQVRRGCRWACHRTFCAPVPTSAWPNASWRRPPPISAWLWPIFIPNSICWRR